MNRGLLQMMAGNTNWWNANTMQPPTHHHDQQPSASPFLHPTTTFFPHTPTSYSSSSSIHVPSWHDNQELPSQLLLGGLVGEEEKGLQALHQVSNDNSVVDVKQENSASSYVYGHANEDLRHNQATKPAWFHQIPSSTASSPKSSVTSFSSNMLDFSGNKTGHPRRTPPDRSSESIFSKNFMTSSDADRFEIVYFLSELVKLNRRTFNEKILNIIRDEGAFSTMHALLVYLQTALQDQLPVVAGLLLQLDLLVEPRKMSIYREEAIDTLISCLRNSEFPAVQIAAAETIVSFQGRFTSSGNPLARPFLLKQAGLEKNYRKLMRMEQRHNNPPGDFEDISEEEKAADAWERRMAFVLVSHEFGLVFEALAEGLKSKSAELWSACFVAATWLVHMLGVIPDTGIRGAARVCLLKHFISTFKSSKDIEDRTLSLLAFKSFIHDPEGLHDLTSYMKHILKGLRELRKSSQLAFEIMKLLSEEQDCSADLWNHKELAQVDSAENGEVLSIVSFKDKFFSGHTDGTIKVWAGTGNNLHLVQEIREHTKAVTSLYILQSGEKLYSGSLDKTARVWSISNELIHCVQVHDMKDQVHNLVAANSISCFIPQGAGVKVHAWNGQSKVLNQNKYIKCLALDQGRLYCGCHDNSIQELDLASGTLSSIQSGSRKLLGKAHPILALQVHNGLIYSASTALDGVAVKIWSTTNHNMVGSLPTTSEVRCVTVSSELIYLGCKGGIVEVWDLKKQTRIEILQTGTNCKVLCMTLDPNEEVLVVGTSDGRIQAWGWS